jgi:hypothetical protein
VALGIGLVGSVVESDFALSLAFILEPNCDGFHFPKSKKYTGQSWDDSGSKWCFGDKIQMVIMR